MIEWGTPWAILLLPLPLVIWAVRRTPRGEKPLPQGAVLYHPSASLLKAIWEKLEGKKQAASSSQLWVRMLWGMMWCLLVMAAMGPQRTHQSQYVTTEGVDIVLVVDISRSMLALDLSLDWHDPRLRITRLGEVKRVLEEFIGRRAKEQPGDRLGLVVFGDQAYVQSPLTSDAQAVVQMLNEVQVGLAGDATAIGDAMTLGIKLLKERPGDNRVMVLLTDGDNTAGTVLPEDAARLVKEYGIRFYAVAVGGSNRVPFPEAGMFGATRIVMATMPINLEGLKELAGIAGGKMFQASDATALASVYDHINRLEKTESQSVVLLHHTPYYRWPLGAALLLGALLWMREKKEVAHA